GQPNMARLHRNEGLASCAGSCCDLELVGTKQMAHVVISHSCVSLLWGRPRVQPARSSFSAVSQSEDFSFLVSVQGLETRPQRTCQNTTSRIGVSSLRYKLGTSLPSPLLPPPPLHHKTPLLQHGNIHQRTARHRHNVRILSDF